MTAKYDSRESALKEVLRYAGYKEYDLTKVIGELREPVPVQFESLQNQTIDTYKIRTLAGDDILVGVGEFNKRFDLWFIDAETGSCHRA